jgi:hypothetical protein
MPGRLDFRTTPDGSTALATRMTIGNVGAFTTNPAAGGHAVFNEGGVDADFRVESDAKTHALFLEGSGNNVGIGTSTLTSSSGYHTLSLNGSTGGQLSFQTGGTGKHFIFSTATDFNMYSTVDGALRFSTNNIERLEMTSSSTIFNDIGADTDFRVESEDSASMFKVDGALNQVQITGDAGDSDSALLVRNNYNAVLKVIQDATSLSNATYAFMVDSSAHASNQTSAGAMRVETLHGDSFHVNGQGTTVINEAGAATGDLRVESDSNTHALFVEGDGTGVGINTSDPQEALHVTGSVRLDGNNNGITSGEAVNQLIFKDTDTTTGGGQTMGQIDFVTADADAPGVSARISGVADSSTTGQGRLTLFTGAEGTLSNNITMAAGSVVINEVGADMDFRVESDTNANMFVVDASTDRVGIGIAAPLQTLHVSGSTFASGYYITVLQGNAQLTNASTSSGSNASYIGQGLITVVVSDAKAKENFGAVEENECLNKIVSLSDHVKKFDWIDEDWKREKGRTVGMVAQEVYEDHSEFVHKPENYNDDGWAIRYQEIVPTLIKAFQEQQELIKTLESRITALES